MKIIELSGTTAADGSLTVTDTRNIVGYVEKAVMDYDDAATGADITITEEAVVSQSIITITNAGTSDATYYPRASCVTTANAAITNSFTKAFVTGSLKMVVAQGGNAKGVRMLVYLSDE